MIKKNADKRSNQIEGMHSLVARYPKALQWGLPEYLTQTDAGDIDWQERADCGDTSAAAVLAALHAAYRCAAGDCNESVNGEAVVTALAEYARVCVEAHSLDHNPWNVLVAGVEIPAVLFQVCPQHEAVLELLAGSGELLARAAVELFDQQGIVSAEHYPWWAAIVAVWARCFAAVRRKQINLKLKKKFVATFEWTVRQLLLCSNGRRALPALSDAKEIRLPKPFVGMLLMLGGDISDKRLASRLGYEQREFTSRVSENYLPDATVHSSESQVTVMRSGWGAKRREVFLRYDRHGLFVEIVSAGRSLFQGNLVSELTIDGNVNTPMSSWEEVCWESDEDADYLELEMMYSGGWRVQKHFLLAKDDNLLLVGDVVLNGRARGDIELKQKYQLGDEVRFFPAEEHNEGFAWSDRPEAMVLPLALQEWRAGTRNGCLQAEGDILTYEISEQNVRATYCPLMFVLNGKAGVKKYTWRQLTIAEELVRQPGDVAAGFRWQIGKKQWLLYRSLTEFGNRTLLGQNYASEFAFGEFYEDGTVYEYVEVE